MIHTANHGQGIRAPSNRWIRPGTPGHRVLSRLKSGEQIVCFGACTPFRNIILEELGIHDSWISSFELSALLGERDDESIGFEENAFFINRIVAKCPGMNMFVDCDTGWGGDESEMELSFSKLSGKVAMVVIENVAPGRKDNSFRFTHADVLATPEETASRLACLGRSCDDVLIALRLENYVCGLDLYQTLDYAKQVVDAGGVFDSLIFHNTQQDIEPVLEFSRLFRAEFGDDKLLTCIPTAYIQTKNLLRTLVDSHYQIVVIPNFSVRSELQTHSELYSRLANGLLHEVDEASVRMSAVIDLVYSRDT